MQNVTLYNTHIDCPKCGAYEVGIYFDNTVIASNEYAITIETSKNYLCQNCGNRWGYHEYKH